MIDRYENVIIRTVCRIMIPFLQLYGLYVIMHGHYSPGGGFQGGVILGASLIILVIAYGLKEAQRRISFKSLTVLACAGVILYSGIGATALLWGGNYLDYGALPIAAVPKNRALGILGIEIGVGLCVMAIMVGIFLALASFDTSGGEDGRNSA
jgi:multicomponent Na+:H+ antiporter subunit B